MECQCAGFVGGSFDRASDRLHGFRIETGVLFSQCARREQKISGVPQEAGKNIAHRRGRIRLLGKPKNGESIALHLRSRLNVAVFGRRMGRRNAKGDEVPGSCSRRSRNGRGAKRCGVAHDMVGGDDQHRVIRSVGDDHPAARENGRPGFAAAWLEHDIRLDIDFRQLPLHQKAVSAIGHHQRAVAKSRAAHAQGCFLEARALAQQGGKLLGKRIPR